MMPGWLKTVKYDTWSWKVSGSGETWSGGTSKLGWRETWSNENTPDHGRKSYDFELEEK